LEFVYKSIIEVIEKRRNEEGSEVRYITPGSSNCVVLSGADGSGKTTTTKLLALYFSRYGMFVFIGLGVLILFVSVLARFLHRFSLFVVLAILTTGFVFLRG